MVWRCSATALTPDRRRLQLCEYVLQRSQRASLLTATLRTLQRFLTWIPLGYIFETSLIEGLVVKFLPTEAFRNDTLMVGRGCAQGGCLPPRLPRLADPDSRPSALPKSCR